MLLSVLILPLVCSIRLSSAQFWGFGSDDNDDDDGRRSWGVGRGWRQTRSDDWGDDGRRFGFQPRRTRNRFNRWSDDSDEDFNWRRRAIQRRTVRRLNRWRDDDDDDDDRRRRSFLLQQRRNQILRQRQLQQRFNRWRNDDDDDDDDWRRRSWLQQRSPRRSARTQRRLEPLRMRTTSRGRFIRRPRFNFRRPRFNFRPSNPSIFGNLFSGRSFWG